MSGAPQDSPEPELADSLLPIPRRRAPAPRLAQKRLQLGHLRLGGFPRGGLLPGPGLRCPPGGGLLPGASLRRLPGGGLPSDPDFRDATTIVLLVVRQQVPSGHRIAQSQRPTPVNPRIQPQHFAAQDPPANLRPPRRDVPIAARDQPHPPQPRLESDGDADPRIR